ncbi:MAG: thymidylate synthase [Candidatus Thorarchaeota archaeon]|nr:thymidylate synthase [Candidatus Thorarchaeota archaeon]
MPTYIKARTPVDGWRRIVRTIMESGMERVDERGIPTRWVDNAMIHIVDPYSERVTSEYPFSETVLREKYATQLLNPDRMGFDYTYGERLNAWGEEALDQLDYVVRKLHENRHTRRAVATTWDPRRDTHNDEVPCLNHFVFMEREGVLDLSVTIRSNDMYGAWPANVYALGELLKNIAERTNIQPGSLTTLSVNAHIYKHDWDKASRI